MKCSGLEVVFGGLTGIINGKALVRPMQAYQILSIALLVRYLQDDVNTCDEISDYMENARQHPMGRHWVDNLHKLTLFSDQFLLAESEEN